MNIYISLLIMFLSSFPYKDIDSQKQYSNISRIWGKKGEKWSINSKLEDFSKAGYFMSNRTTPNWTRKINVEDFGAFGSDSIDDTKAIRAAVHFCPKYAVVFLPKGRYIITDTISIKKRDIIIKGEGKKYTTIYFPKGLSDIYNKPVRAASKVSRKLILKNENVSNLTQSTNEAYTTAWSWSGGFIWFEKSHNVGIEDINLSFPDNPYKGHFREIGNNGIYFKLVKNGWAKNLSFYNCDSGVFSDSSQYLTFENFTFNQFEGRGQVGGHHGVDFSKSSFCLMHKAIFNIRMIHELGLEHRSHHNVYSSCSGLDLHMDHHQTDVHNNLWTDINLGEGTSAWQNNAKAIQHTKSGSTNKEVYWNIKANKHVTLPDSQLNNIVVGFVDNNFSFANNNSWYEPIQPSNLYPKNIFKAQLDLRTNRRNLYKKK